MSKRTYHQYCPVAYSLDIIGERWTMLILRELLFGPRRYTDILNDLPGIGTNLLSNRLKDLEAQGIIQQRKLPPPAASTVYEMTERGHGLIPVFHALADWGMRLLELPPPANNHISTGGVMGSMMKLFQGGDTGLNLHTEIHSADTIITVQIENGTIMPFEGQQPDPDIVMQIADFHMLTALTTHSTSVEQARKDGDLIIHKGDQATVERFFNLFSMPEAV